jgi:restriction system protein
MTFLDAAYEILKQVGQPLHYREIVKRALAQELIESRGKTPEATMNAQLTAKIKRAAEGGPPSPFVRVGRGVFGLKEWGKAMPTTPTADEQPQPSYLTYKEAALRVLRQVGQPLSAQDITRQAIEQVLINPQGLTPDATMAAQLYTDINRRRAASLFRKEGRNLFSLAEWEKGVSGIVRLATRQRQEVKRRLRERLLAMPPAEFEQLVGRLLGAMGYDNVTVTGRSGDWGIDVVADIEIGILQLRTAVQVKRMKGNVQRPVVSQLRGDMALLDVDQGMIITTGGFSQGAKDVARVRNVTPITLIDGDRLTDLLIEYGIGVRRETIEVLSFDEAGLHGEETT